MKEPALIPIVGLSHNIEEGGVNQYWLLNNKTHNNKQLKHSFYCENLKEETTIVGPFPLTLVNWINQREKGVGLSHDTESGGGESVLNLNK